MSFLNVNGVVVPCSEAGQGTSIITQGHRGRTWAGGISSSIRNTDRRWDLITKQLSKDDAYALKIWLLGLGHSWDFEDATNWEYSNGKGLPVEATSGTVTRETSNAKYGSAHMRIAANATEYYKEWAAGLPSGVWTAMGWVDLGTAGYEHYIETGDGRYYTDGVAAAQKAWFTRESDGDFRVTGHAASVLDVDDLVIIPSLNIPAAWAATIYTFANANTWPALPTLTAAGDFEGLGANTAVQLVDGPSGDFVGFANAGTWEPGGQRVRFSIETT